MPLQRWLATSATHTHWERGCMPSRLLATRGVDQGCPLAPAVFAAGLREPLARLNAQLQAFDARCQVYAYLDDVVLIVPAARAGDAYTVAAHEFAGLGVELNDSKTQVWLTGPAARDALPPALAPRITLTPVILGLSAAWVPQEDSRVGLSGGTDGPARVAEAQRFAARLGELRDAGLPLQSALYLLVVFSQTHVTHHLRASYESGPWTHAYDNALWACLSKLLGAEISASSKHIASLRLREGGVGWSTVSDRAAPAFLGGLAQSLHAAVRALNCESAETLWRSCPSLASARSAAELALRQAGISHDVDWAEAAFTSLRKVQGRLHAVVKESRANDLFRQLPDAAAARLRGAGGAGAGAFLFPPGPDDTAMPDTHMAVAVRRRLHLPVCDTGLTCGNVGGNGRVCGAPLDQGGSHALHCPCGGGRVAKHNRLRDLFARLHADATGCSATVEQHVPAWDSLDPASGEVRRAVLDVAGQAVNGTGVVYLDVTVAAEESADTARLRARARRDGAAARQAEQAKRTHYRRAGCELVPVALEQGGRYGDAAAALLRSYARAAAPDSAASTLQCLQQRVSTVLQLGNAEQILSASRRPACQRAAGLR